MHRRTKISLVTLLAVGALALATASAFAQGPVGNYDPLTLVCVGSTKASIDIQVKAGASGAPAGFSLQWMTLADWEANGQAWFGSDDPRLCKMSFSGQPSFSGNTTSRWELSAPGGPNPEVTIHLSDWLFDETGVSGSLAFGNVNHECELKCGTEYVFRAFAHASRYSGRSCFSFVGSATGPEVGSPFACNVSSGGPEVVEPGVACSTVSDCVNACTYTQGYWKNHGSGDCANGNPIQNPDQWCVSSLTLGTVSYTNAQLCAILNTPAGGNGLIALAHQLIAAKLNSACNGAHCDDAADIAAADLLIGNKVIPPIGTASLKPKATSGLNGLLTQFNEGAGCANHCAAQQLRGAKTNKVKWGELKSHYR